MKISTDIGLRMQKFNFLLNIILLIFTSISFAQFEFKPETKSQSLFNTSFCKCDESKNDYNLIRVDISDSKKFETKIRKLEKKTFNLSECEELIKSHPSCQK